MTPTLTPEQHARCVYLARHASRRRAKRYLRDHGGGGRAEELDAVLASASPEVRAAADALATAAERAAAAWQADRARREPREELAHRLRAVAAAADGDWDWIAREVDPIDVDTCWPPATREAVARWGRATPEAVADELDRADARGEHDYIFERNDYLAAYAELLAAVTEATRAVERADALATLRARAVPGGRYEVVSFARGSMAVAGEVLAFDDERDACDWLALEHEPDPTCAMYAQIMDREAV